MNLLPCPYPTSYRCLSWAVVSKSSGLPKVAPLINPRQEKTQHANPAYQARSVLRRALLANSWFRLYAEIRRDPKVRTMPESHQIRLIWLYTLRCDGPTEKLSRDELLYGLDCDETFLEALHETFLAKGFIDQDWSIPNWSKRQYVSDSSTDRVRKFRENRALKQDETLLKRRETQNVTDQNRTEQNRYRTERTVPSAFLLPDWIDKEAWAGFEEMRKKIKAPLTDRARAGIIKELQRLGGSSAEILDQSTQKCWRGVFAVSNGHQPAKPDPLAGMKFANGRAQ